MGIVVTILVSGSGSSDDKGAERERIPAASSGSPGRERPAESAAAAGVRYGPAAFEADLTTGGTRYVDLDSTAPVVMIGDARSKDFTVSTTGAAPSLYSRSDTLAQLPASGPTPTKAQCAKAVADSGTHQVQAAGAAVSA
ncbi:hypothetical protein [Embleya sp. NPDC020630]|uniref:hypothetical protein n=1 Tax=Embleya sp. NPDC020630 TaxID=3363979 RepID=UPI00378D9F45